MVKLAEILLFLQLYLSVSVMSENRSVFLMISLYFIDVNEQIDRLFTRRRVQRRLTTFFLRSPSNALPSIIIAIFI